MYVLYILYNYNYVFLCIFTFLGILLFDMYNKNIRKKSDLLNKHRCNSKGILIE